MMTRNVRRIAVAALLPLCLATLGCESVQLLAMSAADKVLHPNNPKVLIFSAGDAGQIREVKWGRLCDIADCAVPSAEAGSGVAVHYPSACYARWWRECSGKNCGQRWWDRCLAKESR